MENNIKHFLSYPWKACLTLGGLVDTNYQFYMVEWEG